MELYPIKATDLLFTGEVEDSCTNTFLELDDYDWMSYKLRTRFRTVKMGIVNILFDYFGATKSLMKVTQTLNGKEAEYTYEYSTDIFVKHITAYMRAHIEAWNKEYAFDGESFAIDFYNDVLENGTLQTE